MSDETKTIKVTATPETLAEMAVKAGPDGVVLEWPNGLLCATIGRDGVTLWREDESALGAMRRWVAEQIRAGYEAGHAAGLSDLSKITAPVGTPLDEVVNLRREVEQLKAEAVKAAAVKETDDVLVRTKTLEAVKAILGICSKPADSFAAIEVFGREAADLKKERANLLAELGQTRAVAHDHGRLVAEIERLTRERDAASDKARAGAMLDVAVWLDLPALPALPEGAAALETRVRNAIAARCAEGNKADAAAYERGRRQGWEEARAVVERQSQDHGRLYRDACKLLRKCRAEADKMESITSGSAHALHAIESAMPKGEP